MPVTIVLLGGVATAFLGQEMFDNCLIDEFDGLTEAVELEDASVSLNDVPRLE